MGERLIVIGGNAAGMSAASEARRRRDAAALRIDVFEQSDWVSYSACGEPYYVAGMVESLDALIARTPEQFRERAIAVHLRQRVEAIDTAARTVRVTGPAGTRTESYDQLLYATGTVALRPPIEGRDLPGVTELRTLDDAAALRERVPGLRSAVIVGGGYIGIEAAEAFQHLGVATTVLTAGPAPLLPQLDPEMGARVAEHARDTGITVVTGVLAETIAPDGGGLRVRVRPDGEPSGGDAAAAAGATYPPPGAPAADVVLLATGARPAVQLAEDAGLPRGASGALVVDARQRTPVDGVWAAGDCAETRHRVSGQPVNLHLGTIANKQGRIAGINLGGGVAQFPGVLGTAITRLGTLEVARTGLTAAEAERAGFDARTVTFDSRTAAGYWPGGHPLTMRAVADAASRRLLGAQIVGGPGSGKRIDALAVALWHDSTVDEMVQMDLSYAPPFSGVWDPVLVAARKMQAALDG